MVLEQEKTTNQPTPPFSVGPPALPVGSSPRTTQWGKNASAPRGQRGNSSQENSHALFNYFKKGQINNLTPRRGRGTGAGKEASLRGVAWTQHAGLTGPRGAEQAGWWGLRACSRAGKTPAPLPTALDCFQDKRIMPGQTVEQSPRAQVLEPAQVRIPEGWLTRGSSVPQFPYLQYGGNHTTYVIGLLRGLKEIIHIKHFEPDLAYACWLIKFLTSAPSDQARYLVTHLNQDAGSELSALQSAKEAWKVFPVSCSTGRNQKPSLLVRFSNWPQTKISILMWGWKHRTGELNEADWERSRVGSLKLEKCFLL